MKIFQQFQKSFAIYGIASHRKPFNMRNWIAIFIFILSIVLQVLYLFFEAKTFDEYTKSILFTTSTVVGAIIFLYLILEMRTAFDNINGVEYLINKSMLIFNR